MALAPHEGRHKVYLILNAEYLSVEAANSLLKVLEEPPPQVVLILTVADANMLLPTIVSRCQPVRCRPVPAPRIASTSWKGWVAPRDTASCWPGRRWAHRLGHHRGGRRALSSEHTAAWSGLVGAVTASLVERFAVAGDLATDFGRERAHLITPWTCGPPGGATCSWSRRGRRSWSPTPTASTRCERRPGGRGG